MIAALGCLHLLILHAYTISCCKSTPTGSAYLHLKFQLPQRSTATRSSLHLQWLWFHTLHAWNFNFCSFVVSPHLCIQCFCWCWDVPVVLHAIALCTSTCFPQFSVFVACNFSILLAAVKLLILWKSHNLWTLLMIPRENYLWETPLQKPCVYVQC